MFKFVSRPSFLTANICMHYARFYNTRYKYVNSCMHSEYVFEDEVERDCDLDVSSAASTVAAAAAAESNDTSLSAVTGTWEITLQNYDETRKVVRISLHVERN